jgi:hypothetical protein
MASDLSPRPVSGVIPGERGETCFSRVLAVWGQQGKYGL